MRSGTRSALATRGRGLDVLHCTTFRGPTSRPSRLVLTVHDLAILRYPEAFPRWHRLYGQAGLRRTLRAADAVVAVSEFTRHEVVDLVHVPAERIRVVPNGVDAVFTPDGPRGRASTCSRSRRSSRERTSLARSRRAQLAGVELRVVGARGWGGVDVPGWVGEMPDAELAALYRGARCVLYPSLYEGFGLPVLEAMACGTPVVTSRGTAMEEVAGGAAVLVDPLDAPRSPRASPRPRRGATSSSRSGSRALAVHVGSARRTRSRRSGGSSRDSVSSSTQTCSGASGRATRRTSATSSASSALWRPRPGSGSSR